MLYLGLMMSYLHHVPPPVLWLDHVHPSSSQTESRATLQFPDCITCSPPVPWLYHMLPTSSQTVSRATLEFTKCIMPPPPPPLWRHLERNRNRPEWTFGCRTGFCRMSIYYPVSRILPNWNRCSEGEIKGSRKLPEILNLSFLDLCHYQL